MKMQMVRVLMLGNQGYEYLQARPLFGYIRKGFSVGVIGYVRGERKMLHPGFDLICKLVEFCQFRCIDLIIDQIIHQFAGSVWLVICVAVSFIRCIYVVVTS